MKRCREQSSQGKGIKSLIVFARFTNSINQFSCYWNQRKIFYWAPGPVCKIVASVSHVKGACIVWVQSWCSKQVTVTILRDLRGLRPDWSHIVWSLNCLWKSKQYILIILKTKTSSCNFLYSAVNILKNYLICCWKKSLGFTNTLLSSD